MTAPTRARLVSILLLTAAGACGGKNRSASVVETLQASIEAFNRGDAAGATAPYAADVSWILYGSAAPVVGRARLEETWIREIESEKVQLGLLRVHVVSPEHFFAEGVMRGVYAGTPARPAEPRPIGMPYITEYEVRDGAIAEVVQYGNAMALATQMGGLPGQPPPVPDLPTQTEVVQGPANPAHEDKVKAALVGLGRADWGAVREHSAEDLEFHDVANGRTHAGVEGRRGAWAGWTGAFPGAKLKVDGVWSAGDWVVARSTFSGTHDAELAGLEPTHRPVEVVSVDVFRLGGDRIEAWWRYSNPMALLAQLGLRPDAAGTAAGEP